MKETEVSVQGRVLRDLIAHVTSDNLIGRKIKTGELRKKMIEPAWKVPEHMVLTQIPMEQFNMELLESVLPNPSQVVLQLHGGGYVGAMRNAYRSFAGLYSELGRGISVLTIDYRVAPENPFPAALEDAIEAYNWLLGNGYQESQIILAGDSAGGGLALCLCHYLKDHGRKLPAGIIAMSPWTDMTASGESYETNYTKDPLFGNTRDSMIYNYDYAQNHDLTDPYLSPAFGDFTGFPPMLIQTGSIEMLLSDSQIVADKAKAAGVKVRFTIYEGMFHVFQMAFLLMPESKQAWLEAGKFLRVLNHGIDAGEEQEEDV